MNIFLGIVIAIVGLVMLINPQGVYKAAESWKSNTPGEPSDFYLLGTRIGGGFLTVVGIGCTIALIVLG